jgi:AraC-like DNA-binding protein
MARALAIKVLPSTTPYLIVQYREVMSSSRKFLDTNNRHRRCYSITTKLDTGVCTIRPPGPLGAIIVKLKPEASALFFAEHLQCFSDTKIDLGDVFDAHEVKLLEDVVSEAPTSFERVAAVAHFLCAHMCPREPDPMICRAAACLRSNPSTRVHRLAADLHVSERQLLRWFRSVFGVTPKQFARCVRIEKVLVERPHGSAWADIAYGCGFADQAHMINDFNAVLGAPPQRALSPASAEQGLAAGGSDGARIAHDYFFWRVGALFRSAELFYATRKAFVPPKPASFCGRNVSLQLARSNMIGSRRGPRKAPSDHVSLPARGNNSESASAILPGPTAISIRAKIRADARADAES